jgi:PAS domain S-box-containing protein
MTLRKKTLIIVSVTIIGLVIAQFAIQQFILADSFTDLEEQDTHKNVERIRDALLNDISNLKLYCYDWSSWDDTYIFIDDNNEEYIESNLVDNTFPRLNINLMMYVNSTGDIVIAKAYDLQNEKEIPLPEGLPEYLSNNHMLITHQDTSSKIGGIILLPEGPMLVASTPIITSEAEGPIRGTLIMGRFLNSAVIEHLASITHLSLTMHQLDDPRMPPDFQEAKSLLSEETPIRVWPLNDTSVAGYILLNDVHEKPILILRTDMPRGIHEQGQNTVNYIFLSLLMTGLIFGAMTTGHLEKSVLSRLSRLSIDVSDIGKRGDHSGRVSMVGEDELSSLSDEINRMLEALEQSQNELLKSETKNLAILDALPYLMFQIKKDGTIFNYKSANDKYLYVPPAEFLGKKVYDVLPEEMSAQIKHYIEQTLKTGETQTFQYQLNLNNETHDFEARLVVTGEEDVLAIVSDITEHKKAEEARKNEILLKEIHHRVKNNLQIISSLLYLESTYFKDKKVIEKFTDSQNRVKSMALAHEKLYQSKDHASIDFSDYIQNMGNFLLQSYSIKSKNVKLNIHVDDVFLGIDTALPCGLIINELVSNSFKHAFPAGREGEISITLDSDNGTFILIVSDNGISFPTDLDFRNTESLGLQLVNNLVEQIEGTIELDRSSGTAFTITFEEQRYKKRG